MDRIKKTELKELLTRDDQPHLSLYMPTERAGAETQQNPIRFKNLLREAEEALCENGLRRPEAQEFLEPAQDQLLFDEGFWQQQEDGLAIFITPQFFRYYRLPVHFETYVGVGTQFDIKPLFEIFQNEGQFYILALSQNDIRLLEGSKYRVKEIELEEVPKSLAEALRWDDPEKQAQSHTVVGENRAGSGSSPDIAFHGHGVSKDEDRTNILRFFQKVADPLSAFLGDTRIPLILAGVEYLFPIYREANHYNYLEMEGLPGNPENLSAETLHARGWELLKSRFDANRNEAIARYRQFTGQQNGLASNDLKDILQAAYQGRVEQLLMREQAEIWGRADLDTGQIEIHPDRTPQSEGLINTAAIYTLQNEGIIFTFAPPEMPDESPIAAIFRF